MANNTQTQHLAEVQIQPKRIKPLLDKDNLHDLDFEFVEKRLISINEHKQKIITVFPDMTKEEAEIAQRRRSHFREIRQVAQSIYYGFIDIEYSAFEHISKHRNPKQDKCLVFAQKSCGTFCLIESDLVYVHEVVGQKPFTLSRTPKMTKAGDFKNYLKNKPHVAQAFVEIAYAVAEFESVFLSDPDKYMKSKIGLPLYSN